MWIPPTEKSAIKMLVSVPPGHPHALAATRVLLGTDNADELIAELEVIGGFGTLVLLLRRRSGPNPGRCGGCKLKNPVLLKCSRCKLVGYCSVSCQEIHWKAGGHKEQCQPNVSV
jgi:hypothetical protein